MLSRRVGHLRVHHAERTGQRDTQPAEQLWQQLLGVLSERNVARWSPHPLPQQLTDLLCLLQLVEFPHSLLDALGDRKVLRHNHVTPVPLGRVAPRDSNVVDLLVDELPEATDVVLVDLDACDRTKEPFERRNTRGMGHRIPPLQRFRSAQQRRSGWPRSCVPCGATPALYADAGRLHENLRTPTPRWTRSCQSQTRRTHLPPQAERLPNAP